MVDEGFVEETSSSSLDEGLMKWICIGRGNMGRASGRAKPRETADDYLDGRTGSWTTPDGWAPDGSGNTDRMSSM